MRSSRRKSVVLSIGVLGFVLVLGGFTNATVRAQQAGSSSYYNWPASSFDFQNSNYNPQNDVNVNNIDSLELRWGFQIPVNPFSIPGAPPALGVETQAIVVKGIVYVATPYNRVIAINTNNGDQIWAFPINMTSFIGEKWWAGAYVISGLSLYNQTLFVMSSDTTVYALDAVTGTLQWTIPPVAANIQGNTGTYYGEKAPILVGDTLVVRASTTDYGGRGFVAGYDIHTRGMTWIWYSTPPSSGDPNWDSDQCQSPCHGNIAPYSNDWGSTSQEQSLAGGGAAWGLMAVDNKTGVIYFSTGHPSDGYDAALRPGPNLFTDSLVALNSTNGKMLWYYQYTSHDITEHEGGWSVNLATITVNGASQEVVIQGTKGSQVYVVNAATGNLVYKPISIGPPGRNNWNDGLTSSTAQKANLTASQILFATNRICPGPDGGIEMAPAVVGDTLYVATQNACGLMTPAPHAYYYKGATIDGYIYGGDATASQNSTMYAIDLTTGKPIWHTDFPNRYQGAAAVVSGGVVYAVDRGGILYELNQQTGAIINSQNLGGVGASGVSLARDSQAGNMMLFVPAGGGDIPGGGTPGVVYAYWCPHCATTSTSGSGTGSGSAFGGLEQPIIIVLAVLVVVLAVYSLLRRRPPATRAPG